MGFELATTITLIALFVVVIAFVFAGRRHSVAKPPQQPQYESPAKPVRGDELAVWPFAPMPFMTDSEVRFFVRLQEAMPDCLIFAQVQLSRLVQCTDDAEEKFWFNRISRMSADYVLVHPNAQQVLAVIELDDWTHDRPDRKRADAKKDKAIRSAGLAMIRFDGRKMPNVSELQQQIRQAVRQSSAMNEQKTTIKPTKCKD
ncbi:MAG: hypothetical protein RLY58_855 [Pseudomonadota bacterium]|jgi:very-short-patch-repair endonuclease